MPRYCCLLEEKAINNFRAESQNPRAMCNVPAKLIEWRDPVPGQPPPANAVPSGHVPVHRFDADDREQAERYFRRMQLDGCPLRWEVVGNAGTDAVAGAKPWRFRDGLHHAKGVLSGEAVPANVDGCVRTNQQYRAIGSLLGQVNDTYHRCRKENGVAILAPQDRHGLANSLQKCEEALATLAVMVCAGTAMLDPAYPALGMEPRRRFRLVIDEPEAASDPAPAAAPTEPQTRRPKPANK